MSAFDVIPHSSARCLPIIHPAFTCQKFERLEFRIQQELTKMFYVKNIKNSSSHSTYRKNAQYSSFKEKCSNIQDHKNYTLTLFAIVIAG